MVTASDYAAKMEMVTKTEGNRMSAVSVDAAFNGVRSGKWDAEAFALWVSEVHSEAYAEGDSDRTYTEATSV